MLNTLVRLPIGVSFLGHGIVRIPKLNDFAGWMVESFENTVMPETLVSVFAYILPFLELTLGVFLIFGIKLKHTAIAGVALMCLLIFGSSLLEDWNTIAIQMFYGLYFSLIYHLETKAGKEI